MAILVVFRDLVIVGGIMVLAVLGHALAIRPLYVSKVNTAHADRIDWSLLFARRIWSGFSRIDGILIWCVAMTTLASGAAYVWNTARGA